MPFTRRTESWCRQALDTYERRAIRDTVGIRLRQLSVNDRQPLIAAQIWLPTTKPEIRLPGCCSESGTASVRLPKRSRRPHRTLSDCGRAGSRHLPEGHASLLVSETATLVPILVLGAALIFATNISAPPPPNVPRSCRKAVKTLAPLRRLSWASRLTMPGAEEGRPARRSRPAP